MSEKTIIIFGEILVEETAFHLYCISMGIKSYYDEEDHLPNMREPHKNEFR